MSSQIGSLVPWLRDFRNRAPASEFNLLLAVKKEDGKIDHRATANEALVRAGVHTVKFLPLDLAVLGASNGVNSAFYYDDKVLDGISKSVGAVLGGLEGFIYDVLEAAPQAGAAISYLIPAGIHGALSLFEQPTPTQTKND